MPSLMHLFESPFSTHIGQVGAHLLQTSVDKTCLGRDYGKGLDGNSYGEITSTCCCWRVIIVTVMSFLSRSQLLWNRAKQMIQSKFCLSCALFKSSCIRNDRTQKQGSLGVLQPLILERKDSWVGGLMSVIFPKKVQKADPFCDHGPKIWMAVIG